MEENKNESIWDFKSANSIKEKSEYVKVHEEDLILRRLNPCVPKKELEIKYWQTKSPFSLQLHVLNEEGKWKQIKSYSRFKKKIDVTRSFLWLSWTSKEEVYTETREAFFKRCIEDAKSLKSEHGNRPMKLEDLWIHEFGDDVCRVWAG